MVEVGGLGKPDGVLSPTPLVLDFDCAWTALAAALAMAPARPVVELEECLVVVARVDFMAVFAVWLET